MALLRLPYVRTYRDRHGRLRRYFRRRGQPDKPLPGEIGSEEFMGAYQAALGAVHKRLSPHAAGTLSRLVEEYYQSVEFANLRQSSRSRYRLILDSIAQRDGHRLARDMPRDKVRKILQEIGASRPGMANLTQKVLRVLMQYAIDIGWRTDNPVAGIKPYRLGTRHTWSDEELAALRRDGRLGRENGLLTPCCSTPGNESATWCACAARTSPKDVFRSCSRRRALRSRFPFILDCRRL